MASQGNRPRRVHVWFAPVGALNIRLVQRMKWLLSDWEQQRLDRLRVEADKVRFIAAHLLVRVALSKMYPATLTNWKLDQTVAGKPFVCGPCGGHAHVLTLPRSLGDASCWKVRRLDFMGAYVGAVAVSSDPGETIELCINRVETGAFVRALPRRCCSAVPRYSCAVC